MTRHGARTFYIAILLSLTLLAAPIGAVRVGASHTNQEPTPTEPVPATATPTTGLAIISSPAENAIVSGIVQISGTAIDQDFFFYVLEYAADPVISEEDWVQFQPSVTQPIQEGVLGAWNTTAIADGPVFLRVRIIRNDGSELIGIVRVQVSNATATQLPTVPPTFTPTVEPGTPTPGPSPTPIIQQPPTRTPRPGFAPGAPTPLPTPINFDDSPLNPERLRGAALTGVFATVGVFAAVGLYVLLRAFSQGALRVLGYELRVRLLEPIAALFNRDVRERRRRRNR
ncbi:MAG: hypothetical protein GYB68_12215 [Chloroflexi bacterium]|nr:hypothetical protein [Chloroflexota bacterium]